MSTIKNWDSRLKGKVTDMWAVRTRGFSAVERERTQPTG